MENSDTELEISNFLIKTVNLKPASFDHESNQESS